MKASMITTVHLNYKIKIKLTCNTELLAGRVQDWVELTFILSDKIKEFLETKQTIF